MGDPLDTGKKPWSEIFQLQRHIIGGRVSHVTCSSLD